MSVYLPFLNSVVVRTRLFIATTDVSASTTLLPHLLCTTPRHTTPHHTPLVSCRFVKFVQAISRWGIDYVVLTSVDRDDLEDGGANHFGTTVELIKAAKPNMLVECLVSDFRGDYAAVDVSLSSVEKLCGQRVCTPLPPLPPSPKVGGLIGLDKVVCVCVDVCVQETEQVCRRWRKLVRPLFPPCRQSKLAGASQGLHRRTEAPSSLRSQLTVMCRAALGLASGRAGGEKLLRNETSPLVCPTALCRCCCCYRW